MKKTKSKPTKSKVVIKTKRSNNAQSSSYSKSSLSSSFLPQRKKHKSNQSNNNNSNNKTNDKSIAICHKGIGKEHGTIIKSSRKLNISKTKRKTSPRNCHNGKNSKHAKNSKKKNGKTQTSRRDQVKYNLQENTNANVNANTNIDDTNVQKQNHLHDNGFHSSNIVPPNKVLQSILHDTFPILYLPEYISRRCREEIRGSLKESSKGDNDAKIKGNGGQKNNQHDEQKVSFELPSNITRHYHKFLMSRTNCSNPSTNHTTQPTCKRRKLFTKCDGKNKRINQLPHKIHDECNDITAKCEDNDDNIHRLVRTIVVPLSSKLISKVSRPSTPCEFPTSTTATKAGAAATATTLSTNAELISNNHKIIDNHHITITSKKRKHSNNINNCNNSDDASSKTLDEKQPSSSSTMNMVVMNRYNQKRSQPKLFRINQSLMTLVDGVISTLVHKRYKYNNDNSMYNSSSSSKLNEQGYKQKYGTKKRSNYQMRMTKNSTPLSYNELCNGRNILAEGYNLAYSDEVRVQFHRSSSSSSHGSCNYYSSSDTNSNHDDITTNNDPPLKRRKVAHCRNMTPGIQCTQINSCASYARCSRLMEEIHNLLGDDLTREMLLNTIILIPIGECDTSRDPNLGFGNFGTFKKRIIGRAGYDVGHTNSENDCNRKEREHKNDSVVSIDSGNYFQLCGPPLSQMNIRARPDPFMRDLKKYSKSCSKKSKKTSGSLNNDTQKYSKDDDANNDNNDNTDNTKKKTTELSSSNRNKTATSPHWVVPRHSLFYSESYVKSVGFPPSYILNQWNQRNPNDDVERKLLDAILQLHCGNNKRKRRKRWKRVRENGVIICKEILQRHKKCDYARLLEKYCPLPSNLNLCRNKKGENPTVNDCSIADLVRCWSTSEKVISFLCAVLKRVFPPSFWGSEHNFHAILDIMKTFVKLRRQEAFPLKKIVHGIRVLDLKWLFHLTSTKHGKILKSDHEAATILMHNQMKWLYCSFLIPLIRNAFYVTDTEFTGKKIHFYRKPVWSKFRSLTMEQLLQKQYKQISKEEAINRHIDQPMGFSRLRLLPKATGVRPLTLSCRNENLHLCNTKGSWTENKQSSIFDRPKYSTNVILRPTLDVLKFEYNLDPSRFGVGLPGYNRIYDKMKVFVQDLRKISNSLSDTCSSIDVPLFFCSVDINKCYDSINQDHLFKIIKEVVQEDDYLVQQNIILHYSKGETVVRRKQVKTIGRPEMLSTLPKCAEKLSNDFSGAIVLDNTKRRNLSKDSMLNLLQKHLFGNVVVSRQKFGPTFLTQTSGIPQGSVLSTTLCNYYYGDSTIEECVQRGLDGHMHLLVRIVDDFLFITTKENAVQQFMKNMLTGNPHLGVNINKTKSRVSHDTKIYNTSSRNDETLKSNVVTKGNDDFFPWCGLLINIRSCAVHVDYSRFVGTAASDSLTIDRIGNEGIRLQHRMRSFIRPRCQPIFYDTNINKKNDIQMNFYQAIAYSAIKSVNYILEGMDGGVHQNHRYIFSSMVDVIHYAFQLIHSRLKYNVENFSGKEKFWLDHIDALWLGTHSFQSVLSRKKEFQQLSTLFKTFREKLKTKSSQKSLTESATKAMMNFGIESFDYS